MLVTRIFSFSHEVLYPSQNKFQFFRHIYFVVCKCFQSWIWDQSKILLCGRELNEETSDRIENILEKGENASNLYFLNFFLLFPTLLSKLLFQRVIKH